MITSFTLAAVVAVLLAIGFAVGPLLVRRENENSSITPALILVLTLLIPATAWLTYQFVGSPEGIEPDTSDIAQIRASLIDLARQVERNPEVSENWMRMGLAYRELQEFSSAEHAFRRALYIDQDSPFVRVELAETLLFESGEPRLPAEAQQLLNEALEANPGNQKALWLLGLDAFQRGNHEQAIARLERLERLLPEGNVRNTVRDYLRQAQAHAGITPLDEPGSNGGQAAGPAAADVPSPTEPQTGVAPTLTVSLSLDESLLERINGNETVFVIVRPADGPRMPLAVQRLSARDLPTQIRFDTGDSMMGDTTIADAEVITVTARVSHAGRTTAQKGDFEGYSQELTVSGHTSANVHIDQVL